MTAKNYTLKEGEIQALLKGAQDRKNCEYPAAVVEYAWKSVKSVSGSIITKDATYSCGTVNDEVMSLQLTVKFKPGSLFQPHSYTLEQFINDAFTSLIEGEINANVGLRIENPEG